MKKTSIAQTLRAAPVVPESRARRFGELASCYCPAAPEDTIWRGSLQDPRQLPEEGFKLHISADVRHAIPLLEAVGPHLLSRAVPFKMVRSLEHLVRLNAGHYGLSQIGKVITVYPRSVDEARSLAEQLARLTRGLRGPRVPSDRRFQHDVPVYYRYASFSAAEGSDQIDALKPLLLASHAWESNAPAGLTGQPGARGLRAAMLRDPEGRLVPDERRSGTAVPAWIPDSLATPESVARDLVARKQSFLNHGLLVFNAMSQRGKGGVYAALDLSVRPPRVVVLKEGRRDGETNWSGQDGYQRLRYECEVLKFLHAAGLRVPLVHRTFELEENLYVVMSFVRGASLERLATGRGRLDLVTALGVGAQLAGLLARMHEEGWVWRDCKPLNLILEPDGTLTPLDFEGACPIGAPTVEPWMTPAYTPPEANLQGRVNDSTQLDRYALGATLHQLLTGRHPTPDKVLPPIGRFRRGVPLEVRDLVEALTGDDPRMRPQARQAAHTLREALLSLEPRSEP